MTTPTRSGAGAKTTGPSAPNRKNVELDPLQSFSIRWPDRPEKPNGPVAIPSGGVKTATSPALSITVAPVNEGDETDIRHKTLKSFNRVPPRTRRVLLCRLNDVRLYVEAGDLVLTNQDLDIKFPDDDE